MADWLSTGADQAADSHALADSINQYLRPLIGTFAAASACIIDNSGNVSDPYSSVVYAEGQEDSPHIPIDGVAAVLQVCDELTPASLADEYQRICVAKRMLKSDREGPPDGDIEMTFGVIVAAHSKMSLEAIDAEIGRLNQSYPSYEWPDAVAVLSKGLVNYTALIPGRDRPGDFFLPAKDSIDRQPAPSLYVNRVVRATGGLTLNKIASLIMARVAIFRPGIQIPNYQEPIKDISPNGISTATYQFNLSNRLTLMSREQEIASRLPQSLFNIVSNRKKLGSIQFREWQDGGVLILRGEFPLDMFLVFAKEVIPTLDMSRASYFRNADLQVSFVLPMKYREFTQTLSIFQSRSSNIMIIPDTTKYLVQKLADEGTSSAFMARLMMTPMSLRDAALDGNKINQFDEIYDQVLTGLKNAREAKLAISNLWDQHKKKIASREIVRITGQSVHIEENIDRQLRRDLENFLITVTRTMKNPMQNLASFFGLDIGYLFQKQPKFESGLAEAQKADRVLANYIADVRQWSEPLVKMRNDLEHSMMPAPKVTYTFDRLPIQVHEPIVAGRPITEFTSDTLDRVCCFAEEVTVYSIKNLFPRGFEVTEVPLEARESSAPERFRLTVSPGGKEPWLLTPHRKKFEDI